MVTHEPALNEWLNTLAGCPIVGAEASIKLSARGICTDRRLAAVERRSLDWNQLRNLCELMKLQEEHLLPFSKAFEDANQVGFGIEVEQSRVVYKLYFEFWDRLVREIRSNPKDVTPRPLHLGLKWEPSAPGKVISATYTCFPLLSIMGIQDRLTAFQDANSVSLRTTRGIMSRTAPRLRNDSFIYLEAGEESTKRRSYDLNFYKAQCRVAEVLDLIDSARDGYGLPESLMRHLEAAGKHLLGHIGGGQGRDGHDYLTIYYELDRPEDGVRVVREPQ